MRTQKTVVLAIMAVLIVAMASPALANQPIPMERQQYFIGDPIEQLGPDPLPVFDALIGICLPYYPFINLPDMPEPVIDEVPFPILEPTLSRDEQSVKMAR